MRRCPNEWQVLRAFFTKYRNRLFWKGKTTKPRCRLSNEPDEEQSILWVQYTGDSCLANNGTLCFISKEKLTYYKKFSWHVYFAILKCAYFTTLNFGILRKLYILNHFDFAFLSTTIYISSTVTTKQFSKCPQVVHACTWIIVLESIHHNIHLHGKVLPTEEMKSKKCDFVNVSVLINSFFLDYWNHVSHLIHLIFMSCYVRDTYCSRHFNFAIFFVSRNSRN